MFGQHLPPKVEQSLFSTHLGEHVVTFEDRGHSTEKHVRYEHNFKENPVMKGFNYLRASTSATTTIKTAKMYTSLAGTKKTKLN